MKIHKKLILFLTLICILSTVLCACGKAIINTSIEVDGLNFSVNTDQKTVKLTDDPQIIKYSIKGGEDDYSITLQLPEDGTCTLTKKGITGNEVFENSKDKARYSKAAEAVRIVEFPSTAKNTEFGTILLYALYAALIIYGIIWIIRPDFAYSIRYKHLELTDRMKLVCRVSGGVLVLAGVIGMLILLFKK